MLPGLISTGQMGRGSAFPYDDPVFRGFILFSGTSFVTQSVDIGDANADREVFIVANVIGGGPAVALSVAPGDTSLAGQLATKFTTERVLDLGGGAYMLHTVAYATVASGSGSQSLTVEFNQGVEGLVAVYTTVGRTGKGSGEDDSSNSGSGATWSPSVTLGDTTIQNNGIMFYCMTGFWDSIATYPDGVTEHVFEYTGNGSYYAGIGCRGVTAGPVTPSDTWVFTEVEGEYGFGSLTKWSCN